MADGRTGWVLAADIGGTFTDVVLVAPDGALAIAKRLTTSDPTEAVIAAAGDLLQRTGADASQVTRVVHGTTLATNVILERRGAPVAFVTTQGYRSMLSLGRHARVEGERYDLFWTPPEPPVRLDHTFEITERVDAHGNVLVPLDESAAHELARHIASLDVSGVAVCLLHSYRNPAHEQRLGEILRSTLGSGTTIALSSAVLAQIREYERACTTVMSAYVAPVMSGYLQRLQAQLAALGIAAPLHVMECSGGVMSALHAARRAVYTIESGPAAGVVAAQFVGQAHGRSELISFDMGGTTAKAGVIRNSEPDISYEFHVGGKGSFGGRRSGTGVPIKIPAIDLAEVGSGGGSIAWVDPAGSLHVGPRSAGSHPGPACYGLGGREPTVTDADLVLGYLSETSFAQGSMVLHRGASERAIGTQLAGRLGVDIVAAADAVYRIVTANMAGAVHVVTVQRGVDPRDFAMVALGGAAPMHVARLAEQFDIDTIFVPPHCGVGSAMGLVATDLRTDRAMTRVVRCDMAEAAELEQLFARLADDAVAELGDAGATVVQRSLDLRYIGQGHEVTVPVDGPTLTRATLDDAVKRFYAAYASEYDIDLRDPVEIVTLRMRVIRRVERPPLAEESRVDGRDEAVAATRTRPAYFEEFAGFVDTPVHTRCALATGAIVSGPAIVEEDESTLVIPPGWRATVDATTTIVLTRDAAARPPKDAAR